MKHVLRAVSLSIVLGFGVWITPAQWGGGPVLVYDRANGRGNEYSFGVGEFRNDRGQFNGLNNDSAYSVSVPRGFRVRFCENEGRNGRGDGNCEEYSEGNHNLRYPGTASYIQVTGPGGIGGNWNGGWNGGGEAGVTVYEDANSRGRSQRYGVGRYLNMNGGLGSLRNDSASSIVVGRGFMVRLCEDEGTQARGGGRCEDYREGRYNLRYNDTASYIEVRRAGGGGGNNGGWYGGGWDGGPIGGGGGGGNTGGGGWGNGPWNNMRDAVVVFSGTDGRGVSQEYSVGVYRSDRGQLGRINNDDASSVFVPRGMRVRFCESEGGFLGNGGGRCEEFGPGNHNLRYNDTASFIRVTRN